MAATVPDDFLVGPAPNATAKRIDFGKTKLSCYKGLYAVTIDNVLTPEECSQFIKHAEASTGSAWARALVNVGFGQQKEIEAVRKCGRIVWDEQSIVDRIWGRCAPLVPELERLDRETWPRLVNNRARLAGGFRMTRVNERMRVLKYTGGEYFKPHCDGQYITPDGSEKSMFTIHLYLNDAENQKDGQELQGGATTFWDYSLAESRRLDVEPKIGSVLIFQHAELLHSGDDVLSGTKYTMRSDLMYKVGA